MAQAPAPKTAGSEAKKMMWFNISGAIGTALHYVTYMALLQVLPESLDIRTTAAWVVSYLLSILWQHSLHRHLVFGTGGPYWKSLVATYVSYSASIVISSGITYALEHVGVGEQVSYFVSTAATGVVNYFMLASAFEPEAPRKAAD